MTKAIPKGTDWIKDSVISVEPALNLVTTTSGMQVRNYKLLTANHALRILLKKQTYFLENIAITMFPYVGVTSGLGYIDTWE